MATSGTVYHTLFKTFLPLQRSRGSLARRNGIDSVVFKLGASPGLIYAEAGDLHRLEVFTTQVRSQSRGARSFAPVVPPMEAPVYSKARLADCIFPRVTDVGGMDAFGTEMS